MLILRITAILSLHSSSQPKRPGLGHTHDSHSALPFGPNFGGISNGDILPNGHALRQMRLWILIYGEFPCPSVHIRSDPLKYTSFWHGFWGMSGCTTTKLSLTSLSLTRHKLLSFNETFHHEKVFLAKLGVWISFEPRKKPSYFPLYWLVNRDPYNGLL